jgi:hypothetical protein
LKFFYGIFLKLEPVVGFEPTTDGLQNRCSTTELNWQELNRASGSNNRQAEDSVSFLGFMSFLKTIIWLGYLFF